MKCVQCKDKLATRGKRCFECADEAIRKQTFGPSRRLGGNIHGKSGQFHTSIHNTHAGSTRGG